MKTIKNLLLIATLLIGNIIFAQPPQGIPYQAVARNSQSQPMANRSIKVRFSIRDSVFTGTVIYTESHLTTTTDLGLFSLTIGQGVSSLGNFGAINWGKNSKFLRVEFDSTGTGSAYLDFGTQQLMSVPYAFYSAKATTATTATNGIPTGGTQGQVITMCEGVALWTTGGQCPAKISALNCSSAINNGTFTSGVPASVVTSVIDYSGGNGGIYNAQSVTSTGVTGLTATLAAGTLTSGAGSVTYSITGTPTTAGTASFALSLGGQNCTLQRTVLPVGTITALNCASATNLGTLTAGTAASGVTSVVPYSGGNGGTYTAQSSTSSGVTGLTATLAAGTLANGSGTLSFTITGTPATTGTAIFSITFGGASCTLTISVSPNPSAASCGVYNVLNTAKTYGSVTDQDGNTYKTIVIGTQEWMAENLKVIRYRNGDLIPVVTDGTTWSGLTTGATCWYNNDSATYNCPYGKLYNWYTVADSRNLCPTGWHVPTDAEWTVLSNYLGGASAAGGALKTTGTQYWISPNTGATNSSGFSALPGGFRGASYINLGVLDYLWSATSSASSTAVHRLLEYSNGNISQGSSAKGTGLSVRCLRD